MNWRIPADADPVADLKELLREQGGVLYKSDVVELFRALEAAGAIG